MRNLFVIAMALLLCGNSVSADTPADEVRAFIADYDSAYSRRDVDAVAAKLSSSYHVIVDGKSINRDTALTDLKNESVAANVKSTVEQVEVHGDLAAARGTIDWQEGDKSGREYFLLVLKREQGAWKAAMEHVSSAPSAKQTD